MTTHDFSVSERAERLYQEKLKPLFEPTHRGKFLAIEPESGDYFLDADLSAAFAKVRAAHPDRVSYLKRIGFPATVELGYSS
jgi:hypothetical protein